MSLIAHFGNSSVMPQRAPSTTKIRAVLNTPNGEAEYPSVSQKARNSRAQIELGSSSMKPTSRNINFSTSSSKPGIMNKAQLADFVARARINGFTPARLAKFCYQIDSLEKKYGMSFDDLKIQLEEMGKVLIAKSAELKKLDGEIIVATKRKNDLFQQHYVNEKQVKDYAEARDELQSIDFEIDSLPHVKNALLAMKKEDYEPSSILEKLNQIGDLETRKSALQNDLNALNGEIRAKKNVLVSLQKLQEAGLAADQIERIKEVVSRISSTHGINPDQAFERFEQDVLKHYNATLGLEAEINLLQEGKEGINREVELKRLSLEQAEKEVAKKIEKLEESYEDQKAEFKAFSELKAYGIEGSTIIAWQELIANGKINADVLTAELQRVGNLSSLEEEAKSKIKELEEKQKALEATMVELNQKKEAIELSIGTLKDTSVDQIEATSTKAISSITEITKEVGQATESAKQELEATLEQLRSSASAFTGEMKESLKDVGPQLKNVSKAVETARALGKYEALLPLFKLTDAGQASKLSETEALVAMWNITNAFNSWIKGHYANEELEISEPLEKMIQALDGEIQGLGPEEEEEEQQEENKEEQQQDQAKGSSGE
jgi:predicted HTH domain antitoxin